MALSPGQIVATLQKAGLTKVAAAGIAGNAMQESSDNPGDVGGNLLQWQGDRQSGLQAYAHSHGLNPNSAAANLGYLVQDLNGPYRGLKGQLNATKDPGSAAVLFEQQYERAGIPMNQNRIKYAQEALGQGGIPVIAAAPGLAKPNVVPGQRRVTQKIPGVTSGGGVDQAAVAEAVLAQEAARPISDKPSTANPLKDYETAAASGLYNTPVTTTPAKVITTVTKTSPAAEAGAKASPAGVTPGLASIDSALKEKGVVTWSGKPVADWIAPILTYLKAHGWSGGVNSGYRSDAEQTAIYKSGVRPAAVPRSLGGKGSNHEGTAYPEGAVDLSDAQQAANILANSPYKGILVYAGAKDPVHFSHPHDGGY